MSNIVLNDYADVNKEEGFYDCFPIGNGHIGGMIYGNPLSEKVVLNDTTMWLYDKDLKRYPDNFYDKLKIVQSLLLNKKIDEAHKEAINLFPIEKKMGIYTCAGFLNINLENGNVTQYERILDLYNGLVKVNFLYNDFRVSRTYFVNHNEDLLVIKFLSEVSIKYEISLFNEDGILSFSNNTLILKINYNKDDTTIIKLKLDKDNYKIVDNKIIIDSNDFSLFLNISTSFINRDIDDKFDIKYDYLYYLKNHQEDYHKLFNKSAFDTSDSDLNKIFNLAKYLMISSSRDMLPSNLQGIWNDKKYPKWDSKYTININLEMNYWFIFNANLVECAKPLIDLIVKLNKNGKEMAKVLYHTTGAVSFHNTDILADSYMVDHYMPATIWPLGNVWLSLFIYEYYIYTQDLEFLKKYKYIMDDSFEFIKSILVFDETNHLVVSPSLSPENTYILNNKPYNLCNGCTMDDELIKDLIFKLKEINKILNINDDSLDYVLNNLHDYSINNDNTLCEWHEEFSEQDKGHRHLSHLYSLFPGEEISYDSKFNSIFYNTILKRINNGSGQTGWSKAWITCLLASLHKEKDTLVSFKEWIKNSTSKSLLDLHPPFQIDGNFGIAKSIILMFFRDYKDRLELLPSLGLNLKYYKLENFRLKNNLLLKLEYYKNILELDIYSLKKLDYKIIFKDKTFNISLKDGHNYFSFNLKDKENNIIYH